MEDGVYNNACEAEQNYKHDDGYCIFLVFTQAAVFVFDTIDDLGGGSHGGCSRSLVLAFVRFLVDQKILRMIVCIYRVIVMWEIKK